MPRTTKPPQKSEKVERVGIEGALAHLDKDFKSADTSLDNIHGVISTGCLAADLVTGVGGFPRGRLSEVSGRESSGKTTLCVTAAAAAQREGMFVAYLDPEHGLDLAHAKRLGFDFEDRSKGIYRTPETLEDTLTMVDVLMQSNECPLIIVDSVPGMVPKATMEMEIGDQAQVGLQARLFATIIPKMARAINATNTALVFVNQLRFKVDMSWGARYKPTEELPSGGTTLRYQYALRLRMSLVKKGFETRQAKHPIHNKTVDLAVANKHLVFAEKNKVGTPYRDAEIILRYDDTGIYGIDNLSTLIDMALSRGLIGVKGGHYTYTGEEHNFSAHGEGNLYAHLYEHREILKEICRTMGQPEAWCDQPLPVE